jgi:ribonucleotide monophosphatase NagD (HAD superfamily)
VILPVEAEDDANTRVVVVGDEGHARLIQALDAIITIILRRVDRGDPIDVLVPNPDLIYPKRGDRYGFAGGGFGVMVEAAMKLYAHDRVLPPVLRLGKPHRPIFLEALARTGTAPERTAMVGDQLATDIRGANAAGIASVLVTSGVARAPSRELPVELRPRWLLAGGLGARP